LALDPPDVIVLDAQGQPAELPSALAAALTGSTTPPSPSTAQFGTVPGRTTDTPTAAGRRMMGAGVSSGRARGTARVICHPSEGARLQPGDILVAPSTDPAWTPLFLRASAVVMEVGGYLSHGAIVAREYGLPAVVNVAGAVSTIEDGQLLTVDGDAGEVLVQPE
jgi:pyruvate,water dikinase